MDPATLNSLEIVAVCLGALLVIGAVGLVIRIMLKPVVMLAVFGLLGWVMYLNVIPG